jgi:hypothetical protein
VKGWLLCLSACGGGSAAPDAPADVAAACTATWSGNFDEVDATTDACATMTGTELALQVPSVMLGAPLAITIELGAASAGSYSSASVTMWAASTMVVVLANTCFFEAGSSATPHGDFSLALADATAPHGMLSLDQAVLAEEFSMCGDPLTEHLELAF